MSNADDSRIDGGHNPSLRRPHFGGRQARPEPFTDREAALVIRKLIAGREASPDDLDRMPTAPADWSSLSRRLTGVPIEDRAETVQNYVTHYVKATAVEAMRQALEGVADVALDGEPDPEPDLGLLTSREFFSKKYAIDFYINGLLAKDKNAWVGGPSKSLKTSILIDAVVSLATGTRCLDRFPVPRPLRVGMISAESGEAIIQSMARQVCRARGLDADQDLDNAYWGFEAPKLTLKDHLKKIERSITRNGLEILIFDPFYLMLAAGDTGVVDPKDMFQMGPLLTNFAQVCLDAGAMKVVAHHFTKNNDKPFEEPELTDLAYAGATQSMRQWWLLKRRSQFNPESETHELHFKYGGSVGHSGLLHLDITTGVLNEETTNRDDLKWDVKSCKPSEGRATRSAQSKMDREMERAVREREREEAKLRRTAKNADALYEAMVKLGKPSTLSDLRTKTKPQLDSDDAKAAMHMLIEEHRAREVTFKVSNRGSGRPVDGFEAILPDGSQPTLNLDGE